MKKFSVKEVSGLSGVTIRTLHHYDKIGLLKPYDRTEAGYRYYGEAELFRLQQILFYKELDFSLQEIGGLLDDPEFDLLAALENHRLALKGRRNRIATLLKTIDHTITHLKKGEKMSRPEKLYEGLPREMGTTYRKEAIATYGEEAVARSEKELLKMGDKKFKALKEQQQQLNKTLFALRKEAPDSSRVQMLIGRHYEVIRAFWGTAKSEDKQAKAYAGLGELYLSDERFTMVDGKPQPEFAMFLQRAMQHFTETSLH